MIYSYNGILFSNKKKFSSNKCYIMDELWKHYAKWKKPAMKGHILWFHGYELSRTDYRENRLVVALGLERLKSDC